jgi:maleylpyruvate isomerase
VDTQAEIAGALAAHQRLWLTIDTLTDDQLGQPSRLPGWTVGHVVNHLRRNAQSHVRLLRGAVAGIDANRYPGGDTERDMLIDDGADLPAASLIAFAHDTAEELEDAWAAMTPDAWQVIGWCGDAREAAHESPWRRWREVEIHHADLGLPGFGFNDWSNEFLRRELRLAEMAWRASHTLGLTALPAASLALPPPDRLAWLLGRLQIDGLPVPVGR